MRVALKPYGESGILAHDLSDSDRDALCAALLKNLPPHCFEFIEGYDTVLFIYKNPPKLKELKSWVGGVHKVRTKRPKGRIHEFPVYYDGPDLKAVAKQTGMTEDEVIQVHSKPVYTVRMMGFTPGFPYLDGLDPSLHLPRRDSPRKRIKKGSIAIGGPHAGIYSIGSPGGWHLLGRTEEPLFHPDLAKNRNPAPEEVFVLSPGDRLRFKPIQQ